MTEVVLVSMEQGGPGQPWGHGDRGLHGQALRPGLQVPGVRVTTHGALLQCLAVGGAGGGLWS